ncbi:helix-turn-helix domain-containing protein [Sphingobium yanoikuyae]|jgi:predicted XRE-type DNA-binding protein|uniref:XRE family transcriptional regulator n=1 Tax=Sphingobium yanoikuyae TaxID=13690 RepID=A0A9X7YGJ2_SPHYA|nr:XRE family transcriptional regulator [Sphingobium yanoikuyae]
MQSERNKILFTTKTKLENKSDQLKFDLHIIIAKEISKWGKTQGECAAIIGIGRPRLNDLTRGRLNKFSLDTLVDIAEKIGIRVEMIVA